MSPFNWLTIFLHSKICSFIGLHAIMRVFQYTGGNSICYKQRLLLTRFFFPIYIPIVRLKLSATNSYFMVATARGFWNSLTFLWLSPEKCKISLTKWIKNFTHQTWWWTQPSPHSHPCTYLFMLSASHEQCTIQCMNWQFIYIKKKKKKKKYVLEKPTWACSSISSTIFYPYKTIHVCKMYKRILMLENNKIEGKE